LIEVDWDKIVDELKEKGEVEINLWGWGLLNSCELIRGALARRGIKSIMLNVIQNDKVKVALIPGMEKKSRRRRKM